LFRSQGRNAEQILADIERARETLRGAPTLALGECQCVRDLRAVGTVPELPDAASRDGEAYLALVTVDGSGRECRPKVVLGGCTTPEMVRAFLEHWAPANGLCGPLRRPCPRVRGRVSPARRTLMYKLESSQIIDLCPNAFAALAYRVGEHEYRIYVAHGEGF